MEKRLLHKMTRCLARLCNKIFTIMSKNENTSVAISDNDTLNSTTNAENYVF